MLRRFLVRSLVLAGMLLACIAHLVWNGRTRLLVVRPGHPNSDVSWRAVTFAAVALHLWTALTLLGSRYAVGN